MPTPNYGYEKRQRELAKKKKKEEKLKAKAERKTTGPSGEEILNEDESEAGTQPAPGAGQPSP